MPKNKKTVEVIVAVVIGLLVIAAIFFVVREPRPTLKSTPLPSNEEQFRGPTYPPTTTGPFTSPPSK